MRLLLVEAVRTDQASRGLVGLGLGYVAAAVSRSLPDTTIRIVNREIERELEKFSPDIVGISSVTVNWGRARALAELCKSRGLPVIVGGVHISAMPSTLPPGADIGVLGEGEDTIVEILRALDSGGLDESQLQGIAGITYRDRRGYLQSTPPRPPLRSLDTLPLPARHLLGQQRGERVSVMSSRGCPYDCVFCASSRFWKQTRFHSAEYVVRECETAVSDYDTSYVWFLDDLFIAPERRLRQIVELIEKKRLNRKLRFRVSCRANLVTEEVACLLRRMNVVAVTMGLESGSERTLAYLKGGTVRVADGTRAVELLTRAGIEVNGSFIIGSPQETREEILETLSFIKRSKLSRFSVYVLTPRPGTPVWEHARSRGLVSDEMDWDRLDNDPRREDGILMSETLTRSELSDLLRLFDREQRRRQLHLLVRSRIPHLVAQGFKRPSRILPWLVRSLGKGLRVAASDK